MVVENTLAYYGMTTVQTPLFIDLFYSQRAAEVLISLLMLWLSSISKIHPIPVMPLS
jgi:hypothetical protein